MARTAASTHRRRRRGTAGGERASASHASAAPGKWVVYLVLIAAVLLVFWPLFGHEFTNWDDNVNVARNPRLNPPTPEGVAFFWTHAAQAIYIPLTYTVWGIIAAVARLPEPDPTGVQLNPYLFHGANVIVHGVATLLAYQLLRLLVGRRWPACAGALLFALHPVQVEPVGWIAGMKDVLSGACGIAALWQYALFARGRGRADADDVGIGSTGAAALDASHPSRAGLHYGLATAAFVLAMLAKPAAMSLPLAALVIDRWAMRRTWRQIALATAPWFLLAIPCAVVAAIVQPLDVPPDGGRTWLRPLLAAHALAYYAYKVVWPAWLCVLYDQAPQTLIARGLIYYTWVVPVAVAGVVFALRRRAPWAVVAAGLLLAGVLPVLGLKPFHFETYSLVADHYLYVSMLGPALALAWALRLFSDNDGVTRRKWASIACAALLVLLGVRSWVQTWTWHDTFTLFDHTLAVNPRSYVACNNLAAAYGSPPRPDPQKAIDYAQKSISIKPDQIDAYGTLGSALTLVGRNDEAAANFRDVLKKDPDNAVALANLSGLLAQSGRLDEAAVLSERALRVEPNSAAAHLNLGTIRFNQHRLPEALDELSRAVRLDPGDLRARTNYATALATAGRRDDAAEQFRMALRINPGFAPAQQALERLGRP